MIGISLYLYTLIHNPIINKDIKELTNPYDKKGILIGVSGTKPNETNNPKTVSDNNITTIPVPSILPPKFTLPIIVFKIITILKNILIE